MHDKENCKWIDQDTGKEYELQHMKSFTTQFEVILTKDKQKQTIKARVSFSNHCFSKKREEGDNQNQVIDSQRKRDGTFEERVFCPERWEFSKTLPVIIKDLTYKSCLEGGSKEIIYRQEGQKPQDHAGWYICMRLDFKKDKDPPVEIWVRSAHWRSNRPVDIRSHGVRRFCVFLSGYLKSKI